MCHEFQFYLFLADNPNFLVFNAAKHPHCLKAMPKQLDLSIHESRGGQERSLTNNKLFECLK